MAAPPPLAAAAAAVDADLAPGGASSASDAEATSLSSKLLESSEVLESSELLGSSETAELEGSQDIEDPIADNLDRPVLTLRSIIVGTMLGYAWSYTNLTVSTRVEATIAILVSYPVLVGLSRTVPSRKIEIYGQVFDTNPGPFNVREHILLSCMLSNAAGATYAANTFWVMEHDFGRKLSLFRRFVMLCSVRLLGCGFAAAFYEILGSSSSLPWPTAAYNLEVYKMLHDGAGAKLRVFLLIFVASLLYAWLPAYLWPGLSSLAVLCWFGSSRVASVLGAGRSGFGIIALDFNLADALSCFPSLLYIPAWLGLNAVVGGVLLGWLVSPAAYYGDWQNSLSFNPVGQSMYTADGEDYPVSALFSRAGGWKQDVYDEHGSLYVSARLAWGYWFSFMTLAAVITHAFCWHWDDFKPAAWAEGSVKASTLASPVDVSNPPTPKQRAISMILTTCAVMVGMRFAAGVAKAWLTTAVTVSFAAIFLLPIGAMQAVTGNQIGLDIFAEMASGLLASRAPVGGLLVRLTIYTGVGHALSVMQNMKMGQLAMVDSKVILSFHAWGAVVTSLAESVAHHRGAAALVPSLESYRTSSYLFGAVGLWEVWMKPQSPYANLFWSGILVGTILPLMLFGIYKISGLSCCRYVHIPMFTLLGAVPTSNVWYLLILALVLIFQVALPYLAPAWHEKYSFIAVAGLAGGAGLTAASAAKLSGIQEAPLNLPAWMAVDAGCSM